MKHRYVKYLIVATMAVSCKPALAYTECTGSISSVFAGDAGAFYIFLSGGGGVQINASDANKEMAESVALTAFSTGRQVRVRFTPNDIDCSIPRSDFSGIWLI